MELQEKKINIFNNSVGYASQEQGGNLIVKEQWLENPSWEIYILLDNEEAEKLSKAMINKNYVYIPYLGKNDHMADILNCEICECEESLEVNYIDSFFKKTLINCQINLRKMILMILVSLMNSLKIIKM